MGTLFGTTEVVPSRDPNSVCRINVRAEAVTPRESSEKLDSGRTALARRPCHPKNEP
jgi:hypothetical protein